MNGATVVSTDSTESTESTESTTQLSESDMLMASQGITSFSEAELRGEDLVKEPEADKPDETAKETKTGLAEEDKPKEDTEATEETTANSEPQAEKTPKGFVPLAAVHEARGEIRYLKEKLQDVQNQLARKAEPIQTETEVAEDFEVLTDDQFEELADDNPAQAIIYQRKLAAYEASKRAATEQARQQEEFAVEYEAVLNASAEAMEKVAPGIFDKDQPIQKELMDFAETIGFTEDMYYLTNPSTKIILPGETEPLLLGEQAASILGLLVNVKAKTAPQDTTALETKLRTEITAELMKKFKTADPNTFRGINQVPKSDSEIPSGSFAGKVLTTDQLAKLTPAEYERYLAGN